ncbi:MAG: cell division protein ZapA [Fibrobacter sp.]|nr:cell division protein ZapA [Fibrobacter sp.]
MAENEGLRSVSVAVAQEYIQIRTDLPESELKEIVDSIDQRFSRSSKFQMDNRKRLALLAVELTSEIFELRKQLRRAKVYYETMEQDIKKLSLLLDEGIDQVKPNLSAE